MEIIATAAMPWEPTPVNTRGGKVSRKVLREGELLPGLGFYARLVKYHDGEGVFSAPRHKHNYDQIRYTISGTQDFGQGQVSQAGWPSYFPSGAPYGPERIEGAEVIVIQWGDTWVDAETSDAAVAELKKAGEFKNGIYTVVDENGVHRNTDSIQAIWEKSGAASWSGPGRSTRSPSSWIPMRSTGPAKTATSRSSRWAASRSRT